MALTLTDAVSGHPGFLRLAWVAVAAVLGPAASQVPNAGNALPTATVRIYAPSSRGAFDFLGDMQLSQKFASFSMLKGHMDLQFAGTMPDYIYLTDIEIQVYRVINADEFFRANQFAGANKSYCNQPIRWMGVRSDEGLNQPVRKLDVSFFEFSDYRTYPYTYNDRGDCGLATYELKRK